MSDAELRRNLWDRAANTWRRLVDTATVAWDTSTPGQASASVPNNGIDTAQLADNSVTYAKMQNVSASPRILGRKTAGAGDTEECTLSEVLDFIGSAAQGDILYRGASAWERLPAGTNGHFLKTQGAGANPQWAAGGGLSLLNFGTVTNQAQLDIALGSFTAYRWLKVLLTGLVPLTNNVDLQARFSTDGGANFINSGYNYSGSVHYDNASTQQNGATAQAQIIIGATAADAQQSSGAGHGADFEIELPHVASGSFFPRLIYRGSYFSDTGFGVYAAGQGMNETAQDVDAVRFFMSSGNLTTNWALFGYA